MSDVRPNPQPEFVKNLFNSISPKYDLANDVITFGMARRWRKQLVEWSGATQGDRVLDCATGTGDLALEFKKVVGAQGAVIGSDFSEGMLEIAPSKALKKHLTVTFEIADATNLQYKDNRFDVTSIAYGIRNVNDPAKALSEMARVTRSSGVVMILETGEVQNPVLAPAIQWYFKTLVPRLGGLVSGNRDAYEYLNKSSSQFPCQQDFVDLAMSTGAFRDVQYRSLMGGASYIYRAIVS